MASKYNVSTDASKRTYDGVVYDSAVEMRFMRDYVVPRIKAGEIKSVERQVKYELQPSFRHDGSLIRPINYVADFVLEYTNGYEVIVDIKGMPDATAKLKRKLFLYKYPEKDYQWISYSKIDGGWIEYEQLQKARKERKLKKKQKDEQNGN